MFLTFLLVSLLPLVRSQCQVTPSPENVVATQLEGSWIPDSDMNSWLSPTISAQLDIQEFKYKCSTRDPTTTMMMFVVRFYKNESVPFPEGVCNPLTVFMEGELTTVDVDGEAEGFT